MHPSVPWLTEILPLAIGWVTLALVNAGLAQGKNRRGLVWFVVSILVGPLATLAIVVTGRAQRRFF